MSSLDKWRVRDAADGLLVSHRPAAVVRTTVNSSEDEDHDKIRVASVAMKLSTIFDTKGAELRLKKDKGEMIRFAFDAVATFLLDNMYLDENDIDVIDTMGAAVLDKKRLHGAMLDTRKLEEMRIFSMERALDNKDLGKRKAVYAREQELRDKQHPTPKTEAATEKVSSIGPSAHKTPLSTKKAIKTERITKSSEEESKSREQEPSKASTPAKSTPTPSDSTSSAGPKSSRNTPASSSTALEARSRNSRAILCTTANIVFDSLTPPLPGHSIEVAAVPQNTNHESEADDVRTIVSDGNVPNMGAVMVEAQTLSHRIENLATSSMRRCRRRFQFRKDMIFYKEKENRFSSNGTQLSEFFRVMKNPFAWYENENDAAKDELMTSEDKEDVETNEAFGSASTCTLTTAWKTVCVPSLLSILETGFGNAIIHDVQWPTRHGRIVNFMQEFAVRNDSFGPHLIIATQPDVVRWGREFKAINSHLRLLSMVGKNSLRAMSYRGDAKRRRELRRMFHEATGLAAAAYHVIITSYTDFLNDYLHFCQTPFEIVLVDDGCSVMAAAGDASQSGTNSTLTKLWEDGLFSKNDHGVGLAGTSQKKWDYERDDFDEDVMKDALIGLTTQHRIMTSSKVKVYNTETLPFSRIVNFVAPNFADTVREEWDRSRIGHNRGCRIHFQKLLTRSFVVHNPNDNNQDNMFDIALAALQGKIEGSEESNDPNVPVAFTDDDFVSSSKMTNPRRHTLRWLGPAESSWLRYELGATSFDPILEAMHVSGMCGHVCEEVITTLASSNAGTTGQVTGSLAYKFATRCGRSFGSEQGLRQHHSTMHALPGTWLCRICGADCVTSTARTHHERTCGQPKFKPADEGPPAAPSSEIQAQSLSSSSGKKRNREGKEKPKGLESEEKDDDGSMRVPSYRGVWVDPAGKYFLKLEGERVSGENGNTMLFEDVDDAALHHDRLLKGNNKGTKNFNFEADGTRIVYEEISTSSVTGFGGNLDNVVPALSVINIRDLPKGVKPLLRDPRQTSRTGGNSKRHVYAYRGVCRQARKGHDRWQSQISYCGRNFYLGTYESEWDAAAIYAWAHLILYGKAATDQAQKEGEEAAAAYEQEKHDIASGKISLPAPKMSKKEKQEERQRKLEEKKLAKAKEKQELEEKKKKQKLEQAAKEKRQRTPKQKPVKEKKPPHKKLKVALDEGRLSDLLTLSAGRAPTLVPQPLFTDVSDEDLVKETFGRIIAVQAQQYCITDIPLPAPIDMNIRPCKASRGSTPIAGGAMLLGLKPALFDWRYDKILANQFFARDEEEKEARATLEREYGTNGLNETFQTHIQGNTTVIGCASHQMRQVYTRMGLGSPDDTLGEAIGCIDCNIGGTCKGCSETIAAIQFLPTKKSRFQLSALSASDMVLLNGRRLTPELGSFPLLHKDICAVGSRVFVFLLPSDN